MGLETATFIEGLVETNPLGSDPKSQGDNHIRLIKEVLKATFPGADRALPFPAMGTKSSNFSLTVDDDRAFIEVTTSAAVTCTLPDSASLPAGWEVTLVKVSNNDNPVFVVPNSGTLRSGPLTLSRTRRCIPGRPFKCLWTGNLWWIERCVDVPVGNVMHNWLNTKPSGYEIPNGQTLSSSTNYPDYNGANGSLVTPDVTGRAMFGREASQTRITSSGSGINGGTRGATGGLETVELVAANLAAHTHSAGSYSVGSHSHSTGSYTAVSHSHSITTRGQLQDNVAGGGSNDDFWRAQQGDTTGGSGSVNVSGSSSSTTPSFSGNSGSAGSGTAHQNMPPAIIVPVILVVE